ncbi:MAG TPA: heme biosynthesis HemY N-terminal domain-containing protein [Gammaproteobacteria bacterium]
MKLLVYLLFALVLAVGAGLLLVNEPGYVLIGYGRWTLETTVSLLLFTLIAAFAGLYLLLRFLAGLKRAPQRLREWERRRTRLRARNTLNHGLMELAEGNWSGAEKRLIRYAGDSETPLLNYLAAARAAQQQGAHERRDQYLRLAHQAMPAADIAVGLTQAELQIAHRQMEQALATLTHLRTLAPRHTYVLTLLMRLYEGLQDWEHLRELLPELRKRKVLDAAAADALEVQVHNALLAQLARTHDANVLREAWGRLPRRLLHHADIVLAYATQLHAVGEDHEAENLLRGALKKGWDERLVDLYGRLQADIRQQLASAEGWLREHERNPVLLQTLGRLAMRNSLWGKAREYLETGIGIAPTVESYQLLGSLAEQVNDPALMAYCYRKGMLLATGAHAALVAVYGKGAELTVKP